MKKVLMLLPTVVGCWLLAPVEVAWGQQIPRWYAGTWDARIWSWQEHPRTVAVRFEVLDSRTLIPLREAEIILRGQFVEEHITPYQASWTQLRHWELPALTDEHGIAVVALSWQKDYPWSIGSPRSWVYGQSWIRPVDDIEKVREVIIRHPRYRGRTLPFDFDPVVRVGQRDDSDAQPPEVWDRFEAAWRAETKRAEARLCVLNVWPGDRGPEQRASPEFFEAIRDRNCGDLSEPYVGPYLIYSVRVQLDPIRGR